MIPEFPHFKHLELTDKKDVEALTEGFKFYSDFNFTSLWLWDVDHKMMLSQKHQNLIVLFYDYVSKKPFFSFIGKNNTTDTACSLLDLSKQKYQTDFLKLIPEEVADLLPKSKFSIIQDRVSYDYIYFNPAQASINILGENSYGKKIKDFIKSHPNYSVMESSIQDAPKEKCAELFYRWTKNKKIDNYFDMAEYKAFQKILNILIGNKISVSPGSGSRKKNTSPAFILRNLL